MGIATTTTTKAPKQLSDGNSQGTLMGQSATDKIGFYANSTSSAVAQATIIGSNTLSTTVSSTGAFGFGDATTASTIVAAINQLKTLGLIA